MTWGAVVLGLVCVIAAGVYVTTPAGSLPAFMPGFAAASTTIHYKHALASVIVGLALFAFAWFQSAPSETSTVVN